MDTLKIASIEIVGGVQLGPARFVGAQGTRLDFAQMGQTCFWVEAVATDGSRLVLDDTTSYERAILVAEQCGLEEGVPVIDLVGAS